MAGSLLYVSGGCRSGKSAYAQLWIEQAAPTRVYLPTALPCDAEMVERIRKHQAMRGKDWSSLEPELEDWDKPEILVRKATDQGRAILLDCLTLWTSACLMREIPDEAVLVLLNRLLLALRATRLPVAIVSNELGMGLVPENASARHFRDLAGLVNQKAAAAADIVVFMVSGQPLLVRGMEHGNLMGIMRPPVCL